MNPDKVQRSKLNTLTDLPNVGKAVAEDLALLGIKVHLCCSMGRNFFLF